MSPVMNVQTVREWRNREPFQPFELRLSNGETYQVRHPENVAIGKTKMAIANPDTDRIAHIALVHVNSIQPLQTA
jgi:hypothetical protein